MNPLILSFGVVLTTAPAAYDYVGVVGYPTEADEFVNSLTGDIQYAVSVLLRESKPVRVLLVPSDKLAYQANRYHSGSYFTHILEQS